jgi:hypothetical protein
MLRLSVLGSCVTGDPLFSAPAGIELVSYQARTSLVSLNSPPVELAEDALEWPSGFAKRCVLADFRKTVLQNLKRSEPDAVVFDFIDERFDLLRCGASYVVLSEPLCQAGYPGRIPLVFERIERLSAEAFRLWRQSCHAIGDQLLALFPATPLILHRCWWAAEYREGDLVRSFDAKKLKEIAAMNEMLAEYYTLFKRAVPGLQTVEIDLPRRADAAHKFGLAPYHFEADYNAELIRHIAAASNPK